MRTILGWIAGGFLVLSSLAHALGGWPPMRSALEAAGVEARVVGALSVAWWLGSAAMLAFGAIVLAAAARSRRGLPVDHAPLWVIAACYVGFGLFAFFYRHFNPHFVIAFILPGILVAASIKRG